MAHRESPCHAKIIVLVAATQTKVVVEVSGDPVFESVTKDGESIEDGLHETLTIESSASAPWFGVSESVALTPELMQTTVQRMQGEWPGRNRQTEVLPRGYWQESRTK
jgi:hypothetical protein